MWRLTAASVHSNVGLMMVKFTAQIDKGWHRMTFYELTGVREMMVADGNHHHQCRELTVSGLWQSANMEP